MLAWRISTRRQPTERSGRVDDVPVWSFGAAITRPDGGVTVLY